MFKCCVLVAEDLTHDDTGNGPLFVVNGLVIVLMATVMTMMGLVVIIRWKWELIRKYVLYKLTVLPVAYTSIIVWFGLVKHIATIHVC